MDAPKRIIYHLFPSLRGQPPLEQESITRILLIGCASRLNIDRAVEAVRTRFPAAQIVLLLPRAAAPRSASAAPVGRVIAYDSFLAARRDAAGLHVDLKVVPLTGEGQARLKLLSFLLPARRMLVYTEGGGSFSWSFDQRRAIWNHVRWRLSGGGPLPHILGRLLRAIVMPILSFAAFVWLLLWHARLLLHRKAARLRRG